MFSYDSYKNRILKLAKAKRIIHKFRFLIGGALAVIIAGSVGLMVAKGAYMSDMSLPSQKIAFNQPYDVIPAKAFLASGNSQKIEYSSDQQNWTEEKPVRPGVYYARTVSPKLVGYSYSKPVQFEITAVDSQFTITDSAVTYGDTPKFDITNLVSGHRVVSEELIFDYVYSSDSQADVNVDRSSFKIEDAATHEDFTDCYNMEFNGKTLQISQRPISVKPTDVTAIYNGNAVTHGGEVEKETSLALANGDTIKITTQIERDGVQAEPVNAGDYSVNLTGVTIMHGETDVTARYNIKKLEGLLSIQARPVIVTTASVTYEYDGEMHGGEDAAHEIAGVAYAVMQNGKWVADPDQAGLAKDSDAFDLVSGSTSAIINAGTTKNIFAVTNPNYDIHYNYGVLQVIPRNVILTTPDGAWTYDGTEKFNTVFNPSTDVKYAVQDGENWVASDIKQGLVGGDGLTVLQDTVTKIKNAGNAQNVFEVFNSNYTVRYDYGTLIVQPRHIKITTESNEWDYDGQPHTHGVISTVWADDESYAGIIYGDEDQISVIEDSIASITDFGERENVRRYAANSGNYFIDNTENVYGTLKINPRKIVVVTATDEKEYDGEPLKNTSGYTTYLFGDTEAAGLLNGELTVDESQPITEICDVIIGGVGVENGKILVGSAENKVSYTVPDDNYEIVYYEYGALTIKPRRIVLITESRSWEYDGQPHSYDYYHTVWKDDETKSGLLNGDTIAAHTAATFKDVNGPLDNKFENIKYDQMSNYDIVETRWGKLEISPRPISVVFGSGEWVYDGTTHKALFNEVKYAVKQEDGTWLGVDQVGGEPIVGLIEGDSLTYNDADVPTIKNVGTVINEFALTNSNYSIHPVAGELKVTVRKITVKPASAHFVYDGQSHSNSTYETYLYEHPAQIGLVNGDKLTPIQVPTRKDAGETKNEITYEVPSDNYEIAAYDYDNSWIQIIPRPIQVTLDDKTKVYGEATPKFTYTVTQGALENGKLPGDDKLRISYYTDPEAVITVGDYAIKCKEEDTVVSGDPIGTAIKNYIIDYVYGKLTVTKRPVIVTTPTIPYEYDGEVHGEEAAAHKIANVQYAVLQNGVWVADPEKEGLGRPDDTFDYVEGTSSSIRDAGTTDNIFEVTNSNYDIHYNYGTLTVTRRNVMLYTHDGKWTYDGTEKSDALFDHLTDVKYAVEVNGEWVASAEKQGIIAGDELTVVQSSVTKIKDVGKVQNVFTVENANYTVHYAYGYLEVVARKIVVKPVSATFEYDGNEHFNYDYTTCWFDDEEQAGLIGEDKLTVESYAKITDVGSEQNICTYKVPNNNYVIAGYNYESSYLTVTELKLIITVKDAGCKYGDALPANDYIATTVTEGAKIPAKQTLNFDYVYYDNDQKQGTPVTPVNAGTYYIFAENMSVTGGSVGNYEIQEIKCGKLLISPKPIDVWLEKKTALYGDTISTSGSDYNLVTSDGETEHNGELVNGERLNISVVYFNFGTSEHVTPRNVGQYNIQPVDYEVYKNGTLINGGKNNYDINWKGATLTIGERTLNIKLSPISNQTYGTPLSYSTANGNYILVGFDDKWNKSTLPHDEQLNISIIYTKLVGENYVDFIGTPKKVGTYGARINLAGSVFYESDGVTPVTAENGGRGNYIINCDGVSGIKIDQKEVTIHLLDRVGDNALTYGDTYAYPIEIGNYKQEESVAPDAGYNEQFKIAGVKEKDGKQIKNVGTYYVVPDTSIFYVCEVYDESGALISDGYLNYIFKFEKGTVKVDPMAIDLTAKNVSIIYGNTPDEMEYVGNCTASAKAYNEKFAVSLKILDGETQIIKPEKYGVGTYDLVPYGVKVYESDGVTQIADGYKNYTVTYKKGSFEIKPREIIIKINELSDLTYGDTKPANGYTFTSGVDGDTLPNGDTITLVYAYKKGKNVQDEVPTDVGTYGIVCKTVNGVDYAENLDLGNYVIKKVNSGSFKITPRKVTLQLLNVDNVVYGKTFAYADTKGNHKPLVIENWVGSTLPYNEEFKVSVVYTKGGVALAASNPPKNVASDYGVRYDNVTVYSSDGSIKNNGYNNYTITCADLTGLSITPKGISVKIHSPAAIKYGDSLPANSFTYVSGLVESKLPYDEVLSFKYHYKNAGGTQVTAPQNVGTYTIYFDNTDISDWLVNGVTPTNKNYDITISAFGALKIDPKPLNIKLDDLTAEYGTSMVFVTGKYSAATAGGDITMPNGEKLQIKLSYEGIGAAAPALLPNVGTYKMSATGYTVTGGNASADNYAITCAPANYNVSKRNLTIFINAQAAEYGQTIADKGFKITAGALAGGALPNGETISVTYAYYKGTSEVSTTGISAGTYTIKIKSVTISGGNASTANYKVEGSGTLTVSKKKITVAITLDKTELFYGEALPVVSHSITEGLVEGKLPYDEQFTAGYKYNPTPVKNVGTYTVSFASATVGGKAATIILSGSQQTGATTNYEIKFVSATFKIKAIELTLTLTNNNIQVTYGESFTVNYTVSPALVSGETLSVVFEYTESGKAATRTPKDAATYSIGVYSWSVTGTGASKLNYTIAKTQNLGTLKINQKGIKVTLNAPDKFTYGDTQAEISTAIKGAATVTGTVGSEVFVPAVSYGDGVTVKNAGSYTASLDWAKCSVTGGKLSNYYLDGTCAPVAVQIDKKQLTVSLADVNITYGNSLTVRPVCSGAEYGESVTFAIEYYFGAQKLEDKPFKAGKYTAKAKLTAIKNGATVIEGGLDNYKFNAEYTCAINIAKRATQVTLKDLNARFNSATAPSYPVGDGNYKTATNLLAGDKLEVTVKYQTTAGVDIVGVPTDAGTYKIVLKGYTATNSDGVDVTSCYDVTSHNGKLVIDSLTIEVATAGATKVYDGKPLVKDSEDSLVYDRDALPAGYTICVTKSFSRTDVTGDEGVDNDLTLAVKDASGAISENYKLQVNCGKFIITKRPIKITTPENVTHVYDGNAHSTDYTLVYDGMSSLPAIAETDVFKVISKVSVTDVCDSVLNKVTYTITRGGVNAIANYDINESFGRISITPVNLILGIKQASFIYGQNLAFQIDYISGSTVGSEKITAEFFVSALGSTDPITVTEWEGYTLLDKGNYKSNIDKTTLSVTGGRGKIGNYSISTMAGDFKVTVREITLTTATSSHTYDGSAYSDKTYQTYLTSDRTKAGLLGSDEITDIVSPSITNYGSVSNKFTSYTLPANYKVTNTVTGTISVEKFKVKITSGGVNTVYDGDEHGNRDLVCDVALPANHEVKVKDGFTEIKVKDVTEAGGVDNVIQYIIVNGDNQDVTSNFEIVNVIGKLIITQRPIVITTGSVNATYDGTNKSTTEAHVITVAEGGLSQYGLVDGHSLKLDRLFERANATDENGVDNTTTFTVTDGVNDQTSNYSISYDTENCGKIIIAPVAITVSLNTGLEFTYGKTDFAEQLSGEVTLVNGESVAYAIVYAPATSTFALRSARAAFVPKAVGDYTAELVWEDSVVTDKNGGLIVGGVNNYTVTYVNKVVTFEITKKDITVTLAANKASFEYGVKESEVTAAIKSGSTVTGMAYGESLTLAVEYDKSVKNVGAYTASLNWANCLVDDDSEGLANYNLASSSQLKFTVTQANLNIAVDDLTVSYRDLTEAGGVNYPDTAFNVKSYTGFKFGNEGEYFIITVKYNPENVTSAGEYKIIYTGLKVYDKHDAEIIGGAGNYAVHATDGKLTVTGVELHITRQDKQKEYDGTPLTSEGAYTLSYVMDGVEYTELDDTKYRLVEQQTYSTDGAGVQTKQVTVTYKVVNVSDGSESGEFELVYDNLFSTLTITPRPIKVTAAGASKTFDTYPLVSAASQITLTYTGEREGQTDALLDGHTFALVSVTSVTEVWEGEKLNRVSVAIYAGSVNVTANYAPTFDEEGSGKLKINPQSINVTINSLSVVYGEKITPTFTYDTLAGKYKLVVNCELRNSSNVVVTPENWNGYYLLGVGEYSIVATGTYNVVGGTVSNYNFIPNEDAKLTVNQRRVVIESDSDEKEYDGTPLTNIGYKTYLYGNKSKLGLLGDGVELKNVTSQATRVDAGTEDNVLSYTFDDYVNYVFEPEVWGTLTIKQREITIKTSSVTATYTGGDISKNDYDNKAEVSALLVGGVDYIKVKTPYALKNVTGEAGLPNMVEFAVMTIVGGEEVVSPNYKLIHAYGTIIINPAPLTVTLNNGGGANTFEYGTSSQDIVNQIVNADIDGLVAGESLEVTLNYTLDGEHVSQIRNVGAYTASLAATAKVSNADGIIVNGIKNYAVTCIPFQFTITKKSLTLTLDPWADEVYNGEAHEYSGAASGNFADGDSLSSTVIKIYTDEALKNEATEIKNAGTYYLAIDKQQSWVETLFAGSLPTYNELDKNYNVTCAPIIFKVTPKTFTVTMTDMNKVYDGAPYAVASSVNFTDDLEGGDYVVRNVIYYNVDAAGEPVGDPLSSAPVNVGSYKVVFDKDNISFKNSLQGDAVVDAGNYTFDEENSVCSCNLEITVRQISVVVSNRVVETDDTDREYSLGYVQTYLTASRREDGFVNDEILSAGAKFTYNGSYDFPTEPGDYEVSIEFTEESVLANYQVKTLTKGTLTLVKRKVTVKPVINGDLKLVFNGSEFNISDKLSYTHYHTDAETELGFANEDIAKGITATYTITDSVGNTVTSVINAGVYRVKVQLSGDGLQGYYITYGAAEFTVAKRNAKFGLTYDGSAMEENTSFSFDYGDKAGVDEVLAKIGWEELACEDGGLLVAPEAVSVVLLSGNEVQTRYNAGAYTIGLVFEGSDNYNIQYTAVTLEVKPITIMVVPDQNVRKVYDYDEGSVGLGASDYTIYYGAKGYEEDVITITSNKIAAPALAETIYVQSVTICDADGNDISGCYNVIYNYTAACSYVKEQGLDLTVDLDAFSVEFRYNRYNATYQVNPAIGGTYPYEKDALITHSFDKDNAIVNVSGLKDGHRLIVIADKYEVEETSRNWIRNLIQILDAGDTDVTDMYKLTCINPNDGAIIVEKRKINVSVNSVSNFAEESDIVKKLTGGYDYNVTGIGDSLYEDNVLDVFMVTTGGTQKLYVCVYQDLGDGIRLDQKGYYDAGTLTAPDGMAIEFVSVDALSDIKRDVTVDLTGAFSGTTLNCEQVTISGTEQNKVVGCNISGVQSNCTAELFATEEGGKYLLKLVIYDNELSFGDFKVDASYYYNVLNVILPDGISESDVQVTLVEAETIYTYNF